MKWLARLRHEWTNNDGKPQSEWEGGVCLKDRVMVIVAVVTHLGFIAAMIWMMIWS